MKKAYVFKFKLRWGHLCLHSPSVLIRLKRFPPESPLSLSLQKMLYSAEPSLLCCSPFLTIRQSYLKIKSQLYLLRSGEEETEGPGVQVHPQLHNKSKVSLGYMRPCVYINHKPPYLEFKIILKIFPL